MTVKLTEQFKLLDEKRKKAKERNPQKGPIDIKDGRAKMKELNSKNRKFW